MNTIEENIYKYTVEKADKMGRYGLKVTFSDGHNTGIYTYNRLKELA